MVVFQMKSLLVVIAITSVFFEITSAQSQHCLDDFDLNDVQTYTYRIPNSDQKKDPHFWDHQQLNYYVFGKFSESTRDEDTTITAGLYSNDKLIYKTEIDCKNGVWSNKILNQKSQVEEIFRGKLDRNLTSCKAGEPFDLILKVNNFKAMNWIFNAQALQYGVNETLKERQVYKTVMKTNLENVRVDEKMERHRYKTVKRPLTRVTSKYHAYQATRLILKATGGAKFDRLVFGQCNAWPKGMVNQCQEVRNWIHARSKANFTAESRRKHLLLFPLDVNATGGLGLFGNNRINVSPVCLSTKYFHFQQVNVHMDKNIPLSLGSLRAYCCCTDMRTGQVFENDPKKQCYFTGLCIWTGISCYAAVDPLLLSEVEKERESRRQKDAVKGLSKEMAKHVSSDSMIASVLRVNNTNTGTGVLYKFP